MEEGEKGEKIDTIAQNIEDLTRINVMNSLCILAYTAPELRETSNAWIIGVVIGAVLLLLLLGWCLLFAYYNTCGRQFQLATVAATKEKLKVTEDKAIQEGSKNDYTAAPGLPQSLTSVPQKIYLTEHDVQTDPKFYEK